MAFGDHFPFFAFFTFAGINCVGSPEGVVGNVNTHLRQWLCPPGRSSVIWELDLHFGHFGLGIIVSRGGRPPGLPYCQ